MGGLQISSSCRDKYCVSFLKWFYDLRSFQKKKNCKKSSTQMHRMKMCLFKWKQSDFFLKMNIEYFVSFLGWFCDCAQLYGQTCVCGNVENWTRCYNVIKFTWVTEFLSQEFQGGGAGRQCFGDNMEWWGDFKKVPLNLKHSHNVDKYCSIFCVISM